MADKKDKSILVGNFNLGLSYLITAVLRNYCILGIDIMPGPQNEPKLDFQRQLFMSFEVFHLSCGTITQ